MGVMMNETINIEHEIHELALKIKEELIKRGEMMATAESCTGGLIASSIVNEPGSSAILKGGIVAYQNEVKHELLGVSDEILAKYGAVSEQTVKAMAEGARKQFGTDILRERFGAIEKFPIRSNRRIRHIAKLRVTHAFGDVPDRIKVECGERLLHFHLSIGQALSDNH